MKVPKMKNPPPPPENSMAQANANYDRWKDARDVYKALSDFVMEKNRTLPMHDADWLEFAQYFAQRCGVVLDGNSEIPNNHKCDHPYHSVVGGNGRPERCLTCGKVLSI